MSSLRTEVFRRPERYGIAGSILAGLRESPRDLPSELMNHNAAVRGRKQGGVFLV